MRHAHVIAIEEDGTRRLTVVFWLPVPAGQETPLPEAGSAAPDATAAELVALRRGEVVETEPEQLSWEAGTPDTAIRADLETRWRARLHERFGNQTEADAGPGLRVAGRVLVGVGAAVSRTDVDAELASLSERLMSLHSDIRQLEDWWTARGIAYFAALGYSTEEQDIVGSLINDAIDIGRIFRGEAPNYPIPRDFRVNISQAAGLPHLIG